MFGLLNYLRIAEPNDRDCIVAILKGSSQRMVAAGYSGKRCWLLLLLFLYVNESMGRVCC